MTQKRNAGSPSTQTANTRVAIQLTTSTNRFLTTYSPFQSLQSTVLCNGTTGETLRLVPTDHRDDRSSYLIVTLIRFR